MENTRSILAAIFRNAGMEEKFTLARLQAEWTDYFDAPLSMHTFPSGLNKGFLTVNVDSPLWMQQLKFFKQPMLKKLSAAGITAIDFRRGRVDRPVSGAAGKEPGREKSSPGKLSGPDAEWIDRTLSCIEDAELREQIRSVLEKALTR